MKKIGILTLNGEYNYGNRLQNYALQKTLQNLDYHAETIAINSRTKVVKNIVKKLASSLPIKSEKLNSWRMFTNKEKKLTPFSDIYIKTRVIKPSAPGGIVDEYIVFIAGSDQVWNPNYIKSDDTNFLQFAPTEKRVSYAASFGVSEIPSEQKGFYKKNLEGMRSISVREDDGKRIVEELTGRKDVVVVPDPTMLLDPQYTPYRSVL